MLRVLKYSPISVTPAEAAQEEEEEFFHADQGAQNVFLETCTDAYKYFSEDLVALDMPLRRAPEHVVQEHLPAILESGAEKTNVQEVERHPFRAQVRQMLTHLVLWFQMIGQAEIPDTLAVQSAQTKTFLFHEFFLKESEVELSWTQDPKPFRIFEKRTLGQIVVSHTLGQIVDTVKDIQNADWKGGADQAVNMFHALMTMKHNGQSIWDSKEGQVKSPFNNFILNRLDVKREGTITFFVAHPHEERHAAVSRDLTHQFEAHRVSFFLLQDLIKHEFDTFAEWLPKNLVSVDIVQKFERGLSFCRSHMMSVGQQTVASELFLDSSSEERVTITPDQLESYKHKFYGLVSFFQLGAPPRFRELLYGSDGFSSFGEFLDRIVSSDFLNIDFNQKQQHEYQMYMTFNFGTFDLAGWVADATKTEILKSAFHDFLGQNLDLSLGQSESESECKEAKNILPDQFLIQLLNFRSFIKLGMEQMQIEARKARGATPTPDPQAQQLRPNTVQVTKRKWNEEWKQRIENQFQNALYDDDEDPKLVIAYFHNGIWHPLTKPAQVTGLNAAVDALQGSNKRITFLMVDLMLIPIFGKQHLHVVELFIQALIDYIVENYARRAAFYLQEVMEGQEIPPPAGLWS